MTDEAAKPGLGLAIGMLFLALLPARGLLRELGQWDALAVPLRLLDLAFVVAATVLAASGVCALVSTRLRRVGWIAGCAAGATLGGGLILGTLLNVIPCSSPS